MTTTITPGTPGTRRLALALPLLFVVQLVLVGLAVFPQLSARVAGDEIRLRVEPVDPIDPFRGVYATLGYPDLRASESEDFQGGLGSMEDDQPGGDVFIVLAREGDVWVATDWVRERPESGRYLSCNDRDWQIECGIESFFLPQDEARAVEEDIRDGELVAVVKVDGRGNAAVAGLERP